MGHRRFLSRNHRFRLNQIHFNGDTEERNSPSKISGSNILRQTKDLDVTFGKEETLDSNRKRPRKKFNNGIKEAYSLNFHIGSLICCVII